MGHSHVARSPLCETYTRHGSRLFGSRQAVAVLNLQSEQQLAIRVERPRVGLRNVLSWIHIPNGSWHALAAAAAQSLRDDVPCKRLERVA